MKLYVSKINESWIVDRLRKEWYQYNSDISTNFLHKCDLIWLISPWTWEKISKKNLESKNIVCSIHHIDFDKFNEKNVKKEFYEREKFIDSYHVFSSSTEKQLKTISDKKIIKIPYWVNQNLWFYIPEKNKLRSKYGFNKNEYLVGSFQRDTEGHDLESPKFSKGPDIFIKKIINLSKEQKNLKVVLTGKRRNYVINELEKNNISFSYFEMVTLKALNELYNILDLYIVSSRVEGGPQAILECGISKTPIISTRVGIADEILDENSIVDFQDQLGIPNPLLAYENTKEFCIPNGMNKFRKYFKSLLNEN